MGHSIERYEEAVWVLGGDWSVYCKYMSVLYIHTYDTYMYNSNKNTQHIPNLHATQIYKILSQNFIQSLIGSLVIREKIRLENHRYRYRYQSHET